MVPLNVLLKGREIAYHLWDADVTAFFCFEGTAELPMGAEGFAAFSKADAVEHFFLITADAAAPSPIDGAETLGAALTGTGTKFEPVPTEATDTAIILPTSGTHRTGQGRRAPTSAQ